LPTNKEVTSKPKVITIDIDNNNGAIFKTLIQKLGIAQKDKSYTRIIQLQVKAEKKVVIKQNKIAK